MDQANYQQIFQAFSDDLPVSIKAIGAGNINDTLKVKGKKRSYLLQRINHQVFKDPEQVQKNYQLIYDHLSRQDLGLELPTLIRTKSGASFTRDAEGRYWRLVAFIDHTVAHEQAQHLAQVKEAAAKIGQFVAGLNQAPTPQIGETIPDFHHFQARYLTFEAFLPDANKSRLKEAKTAIHFIQKNASQVPDYQGLELPRRLVHNDPKIGNVLFDEAGAVVAVIDWDTVMPGYLATDLGDMIRTMAVNADEDERELSRVYLRKDYLEACLENFLLPLRGLVTPPEKQYLASGPLYIVMEQALRFLYDYLAEDRYYKIKYPQHNLHRSLNQIELCRSIMEEQTFIRQTIDRVLV